MPWFDRAIAIVMAALLVAGFGSSIYAFWAKGFERETRKLLKRYASLGISSGLSGLALWFFNWQGVPVLSMRFLWIVWFGCFAYWAFTIARYQQKELPMIRAARAQQEEARKWLPKPKG